MSIAMVITGCNSSSSKDEVKDYEISYPDQCSQFVTSVKIEGEQDYGNTYTDIKWAQNALYGDGAYIPSDGWYADGEASPISDSPIRFDSQGYINFSDVYFSEAGNFRLLLRASSPWGVKPQNVKVRNQSNGDYIYDGTVDLWQTLDRPVHFTDYEILLQVEESGYYEVEISANHGYSFFDVLKIPDQKSILNSKLGSQVSTFTHEAPQDFKSNIQFNYNRVVGFELNGTPVPAALSETCEQVIISSDHFTGLSEGQHEIKAIFDEGADGHVILQVKDSIITPNDGIYYAAEQAVGDGAVVLVDHAADQKDNLYVNIASSGYITYTVKVEEDGLYRMDNRYRSPNGVKWQHFHINGENVRPSISVSQTQGEEWGTEYYDIPLKAGINDISFIYQIGDTDFDWIKISEEKSDTPAVLHNPEQSYYQSNIGSNHQNMRFAISPSNHELLDVEVFNEDSGQKVDIPYEIIPLDLMVETHEIVNVINGSFWVEFSAQDLDEISAGDYKFVFNFESGNDLSSQVSVYDSEYIPESVMTIVHFSVNHGQSSLIVTPEGKNILNDLGKPEETKNNVIPFLNANNIQVDELWISHDHDDHVGAIDYFKEVYPQALIKEAAPLSADGHSNIPNDGCTPGDPSYDFRTELSGRVVHGLEWLIMNQNGDHCVNDYLDDNPNALAYIFTYHGIENGALNGKTFRFNQQSDVYHDQQLRFLKDYGLEGVESNIFQSNHHFHGSTDQEYVEKSNADYIFVTASPEVYGRAPFTTTVRDAVQTIQATNPNYKAMHETYQVGHSIVHVLEDASYRVETVYMRENYGQDFVSEMKVENLRHLH
ncbi:MBL fold metallo-hydrolase [Photobacterium sp. DNB23_23_1]